MAVGGVIELIAVSFYAFIGIRMSRLKVVKIIPTIVSTNSQTLPKSITTATVSAVLVSTGTNRLIISNVLFF